MFSQKTNFCFLIIVMVFTVLNAQSPTKSSLKYTNSFAYRIHSSHSISQNTSETLHNKLFRVTPKNFKDSRKPGSLAGAVIGGVAGSVVGFVGGALIGVSVYESHEPFGDVVTAFLAGSAGETICLAGGVHIGNGCHGRFDKDLLISALIAAAGAELAIAKEDGKILLAIPIVQLIATVYVERKETPLK